MLTIKRVPTVVSNYQENAPLEDHKSVTLGCDRNFLGSCWLPGQWEDRMRRGLFKHDVTSCETKVIPGKYGFIAQLNKGSHIKKPPTEFRIDKIIQPFDDSKFNFTKVGQEEVLFRFEPGTGNKSYYCASTSASTQESSPIVVTINHMAPLSDDELLDFEMACTSNFHQA
ncbi:GDP-L-galactose phosphorylase 1-like isoform X1 [Primulina eburnea]|uniref:GDP-L-galactose phosphorylase 1-like isoform X1 n=1 Tax=Primulina eburnea TaxID=1245227 RepID=UPI003C6BDC25